MVSWQCPARNSHVIPNEKREARASLPTVLGNHEETVTMRSVLRFHFLWPAYSPAKGHRLSIVRGASLLNSEVYESCLLPTGPSHR